MRPLLILLLFNVHLIYSQWNQFGGGGGGRNADWNQNGMNGWNDQRSSSNLKFNNWNGGNNQNSNIPSRNFDGPNQSFGGPNRNFDGNNRNFGNQNLNNQNRNFNGPNPNGNFDGSNRNFGNQNFNGQSRNFGGNFDAPNRNFDGPNRNFDNPNRGGGGGNNFGSQRSGDFSGRNGDFGIRNGFGQGGDSNGPNRNFNPNFNNGPDQNFNGRGNNFDGRNRNEFNGGRGGNDMNRGGDQRSNGGRGGDGWGPSPMNLEERPRENRGGGVKRGGKGWKRSRPIDKAHAFFNLRKFGRGTKSIRSEDWAENAKQFCSVFPHHRKCRDGAKPEETDLDEMSQAIERRHKRRKIPRMQQHDWFGGVPADLRERAKDRQKSFGRIKDETRNHFKNSCRSGRVNCRIQPEESRQKRKLLRDHLAQVEREKLNVDEETADDNVEIRFDRTLRIKRALLEKANLTAEVDPIDDGIFEQDILLTENQSNMILNHLDKAETTGDENLSPDEIDETPKPGSDSSADPSLPPSDPIDGSTPPSDLPPSDPSIDNPPSDPSLDGSRKRRSGVFLEQNFAEKWDISSPIPYTFDSSIAPWDKTDITDALAEISRVSCVRFRLLTSTPTGNHINFVKINSPTFCGLSYVGRVAPVNTVYLSFQCGKNKGVVMHETLHALGIIHQHLRVDRDQFIKVDWSNVNPQKYDQFATADQSLYTSYGIKYSYDSIMHYNGYTNAIDTKKPTMIPLVNSASNLALLGQRDKLSTTDVNLLNKMYCKAASCVDTNIYCGHWALSGVCTLQGNSIWMSQNCKKSCNLC